MRSTFDAQPFRIAVPDDALLDLKERLARTRWPNEPRGAAWSYGASLAYMREVADYWKSRYDWRRAEVELNSHTHYKADIDGKQVHFLVEIGSGPAPMPLLLTHGWPGSIVEFLDIIDPLAHPELHGGKVEDAFTVIAPSLPGYGFSDPPDAPITPRDIGHTWQQADERSAGGNPLRRAGLATGAPLSHRGWRSIIPARWPPSTSIWLASGPPSARVRHRRRLRSRPISPRLSGDGSARSPTNRSRAPSHRRSATG